MNNPVWILLAGVVVAAAFWYYQNGRKTITVECANRKPDKFPPWDEAAIPHGDLRRIADAYLTPVIGGDPHLNGSKAGGFFKAINVYPSMNAGRYYQNEMAAWAASNEGLPYWQTVLGEFICEN